MATFVSGNARYPLSAVYEQKSRMVFCVNRSFGDDPLWNFRNCECEKSQFRFAAQTVSVSPAFHSLAANLMRATTVGLHEGIQREFCLYAGMVFRL
jgi:hypothetical protein